ncbi:1493_t:CDS:2, partial [Racocetra fulgida]
MPNLLKKVSQISHFLLKILEPKNNKEILIFHPDLDLQIPTRIPT